MCARALGAVCSEARATRKRLTDDLAMSVFVVAVVAVVIVVVVVDLFDGVRLRLRLLSLSFSRCVKGV